MVKSIPLRKRFLSLLIFLVISLQKNQSNFDENYDYEDYYTLRKNDAISNEKNYDYDYYDLENESNDTKITENWKNVTNITNNGENDINTTEKIENSTKNYENGTKTTENWKIYTNMTNNAENDINTTEKMENSTKNFENGTKTTENWKNVTNMTNNGENDINTTEKMENSTKTTEKQSIIENKNFDDISDKNSVAFCKMKCEGKFLIFKNNKNGLFAKCFNKEIYEIELNKQYFTNSTEKNSTENEKNSFEILKKFFYNFLPNHDGEKLSCDKICDSEGNLLKNAFKGNFVLMCKNGDFNGNFENIDKINNTKTENLENFTKIENSTKIEEKTEIKYITKGSKIRKYCGNLPNIPNGRYIWKMTEKIQNLLNENFFEKIENENILNLKSSKIIGIIQYECLPAFKPIENGNLTNLAICTENTEEKITKNDIKIGIKNDDNNKNDGNNKNFDKNSVKNGEKNGVKFINIQDCVFNYEWHKFHQSFALLCSMWIIIFAILVSVSCFKKKNSVIAQLNMLLR